VRGRRGLTTTHDSFSVQVSKDDRLGSNPDFLLGGRTSASAVQTLVEKAVRWSSCAILLSVTKRKRAQQAEPLSINVLCVQCSLGNRITLPSTHSSISGSGKSVNSMCFENTTLPLPSSQERVAVELVTTNFHD
jgi:hypothetical protein